jgi:hypothetical protein
MKKKEYENRYKNTINHISEPGYYVGDFEIHAASCSLDRNISIYTKGVEKYLHYAAYHSISNIKEITIYILYVNNNHYNLIVIKD